MRFRSSTPEPGASVVAAVKVWFDSIDRLLRAILTKFRNALMTGLQTVLAAFAAVFRLWLVFLIVS